MATKLKSISKIGWVRVVAFILAVIMFAFSGYFASMFAKSEFIYNSFDGRPYLQTASFRDILNIAQRAAIYEGEMMLTDTVEEFEKTYYGAELKSRYAEIKQTAESSYDLLDKSGIGVYVTKNNKYRYRLMHNGEAYYFTYNGELITAEQFNSYTYIRSNEGVTDTSGDGVTVPESTQKNPVQSLGFSDAPEVIDIIAPTVEVSEEHTTVMTPEDEINAVDMTYISKISNALNFIFCTEYNGYNLNYGEVSKEAFLLSIDNAYRTELNQRYDESKMGNGEYYILSQIDSIRYAVKFNNSGEVLSNSNVAPTDNRQIIVQKLGGKLIESFENGKYVSATEEMPRSDSFLAQLYYELAEGSYDSLLTHHLALIEGGSVEWAYFSYDPAMSEGDIVTVCEKLFNAHTAKLKITRSVTFTFSAAIILFVFACAIGIWLIASAGKTEDGEVRLCFYDKIPFEINLLAGLGIMALCVIAVIALVVYELFPSQIAYAGGLEMRLAAMLGTFSSSATALLVAIVFAIPTILLMSVARNIKAKTFRKHTLCRYIFMPVVWFFKKISEFFKNLKYIFTSDYSEGKAKKFKVISSVAVTVFFVINALLVLFGFAWGHEFGAFLIILAFILDVAAIFYCVLIIVSLDRVMHAVSDIRNGKTDAKIDTERMPLFLKKFAGDITSIGDGFKDAVESAVKDQRMKAELITNVSHDLKTPLTSIVSYVDLLKRCNVEDEDAVEYISILDEKAHRMKKLIEDLVEASKASSGAMEVHPVKVNLCEFAVQAVGEHEDELKAKGIDIVLTLPQKTVNAMADPMKISRVVENLFSNIRKYAMEGTRVYAEISENDGFAVLTIKNISRNPLNVPAEELMQRFVRGDSSRTGEGSGLGLSIVKNLCELQGGRFSISVDGDLFKAVVELPEE